MSLIFHISLTGLTIVLGIFVLYLISKARTRISKTKQRSSEETQIKNKSIIDTVFIMGNIFLSASYSIDKVGVKRMTMTKAGMLFMSSCILGGFILINAYRGNLLSNLTVQVYEKPLRKIDG